MTWTDFKENHDKLILLKTQNGNNDFEDYIDKDYIDDVRFILYYDKNNYHIDITFFLADTMHTGISYESFSHTDLKELMTNYQKYVLVDLQVHCEKNND